MAREIKSYAYIRRAYGVNPVPGARVKHTVTQKVGTIVRSRKCPHYVRVRFDGSKHISNAHPKELDYTYEDPSTHAA